MCTVFRRPSSIVPFPPSFSFPPPHSLHTLNVVLVENVDVGGKEGKNESCRDQSNLLGFGNHSRFVGLVRWNVLVDFGSNTPVCCVK